MGGGTGGGGGGGSLPDNQQPGEVMREAQTAKEAYLKRMGITEANLEKRVRSTPTRKVESAEVAHARGVLAAKNMGGPVPMKDVNAAIKTMKKHGHIVRGSEVVS